MANIDKIEAAKANAAAALAKEIARIEWEEALRAVAPEGIEIKSVAHVDYNDTDLIRYEARDSAGVAAIISAYRDKYGAFLPIGKYKDGCCTLTAYPYKDYLKPEALKAIEADAVEVRNSKGRGFSAVEFAFYPATEGRRIAVEIDLAFRCCIAGFEGRINAHYDRNGDPTTVEKFAPSAHKGAAFGVFFSGGLRDSADWRAVFSRDALLTALEGK